MGRDTQPPLDPPRRKLQERPSMPAAMNDRIKHDASRAAVKRLEGEDIQLVGHR